MESELIKVSILTENQFPLKKKKKQEKAKTKTRTKYVSQMGPSDLITIRDFHYKNNK